MKTIASRLKITLFFILFVPLCFLVLVLGFINDGKYRTKFTLNFERQVDSFEYWVYDVKYGYFINDPRDYIHYFRILNSIYKDHGEKLLP